MKTNGEAEALVEEGRRVERLFDQALAWKPEEDDREQDGPPYAAELLRRAASFLRKAAAAVPELEPERDRLLSLPVAQDEDLDSRGEEELAGSLSTVRRLVCRALAELESPSAPPAEQVREVASKVAALSGEYISKEDLAEFIGKHPRTLDNWSVRRYGPPRISVGGRHLYRLSQVRKWLDSLEQRTGA